MPLQFIPMEAKMPKTVCSLTLVAVIALFTGSGAALSAPATPPIANTVIGADNPNFTKVANKWNRDRDGRRCSHRSDRCRHHYRGYYYETPWWTLPLIIGGGIAAGRDYDDYDDYNDYDDGYYTASDDHVQWCLDRYRSYNLRTNTWVSNSGRIRQCVSPFS
jgi:hypothetical protein